MSAHTPGPWHVGEGKAARIVYARDGFAVADAAVFHDRDKPGEGEANARLIAAAPDLLAALREILADAREPYRACEKARAALAKVTL